ncbi:MULTISPECIES: ABC transporter ATP-binding protein [unclassified Sporosarcina]|uniref:ABC transporter ATP-binding protein n=1 Tax=unclassified Sporosarcina TaxID=2647733 RepID=UPI000C16B36A|nr:MULTISPECIES: ABC transporter ATP-binding protein [unclassified Sporosarcina]PID15011.1 ABC transporter ATP-binding protein [Sporosarcina sp. P34]PID25221.1 ABC transporter ATP-binding protein [Sporosarcina sp. P7]
MLSLKDIHTFYGHSHILQGVELYVQEGECVALLGRNGAGKTTTIHTIAGLTPAKKGNVHFNGKEISKLSPHHISKEHLALVPQGKRVFQSLTIKENLIMPSRPSKHKKEGLKYWTIDEVYELFPVLKKYEQNMGNELSGGQQQMLAIGRALVTNPVFVLMDEPSEGLAPVIIDQITDIINDLKKTGLSILVVEQNLKLACDVADRVLVMNKGIIVWEGAPDALLQNKEVLQKYLGV